jgi:hypothetical protein
MTAIIIGTTTVVMFGLTLAVVSGCSAPPSEQEHTAQPTLPESSTTPTAGNRELFAPPTSGALFEPAPDDNGLTIPWLTEEQKAKAVEIAMSDHKIQELIKERPYEIGEVGLVHVGEVQLGAILVIHFNNIYKITYDWPYAQLIDLQNGQPIYSTGTYYATRDVTRLEVEVNLKDEIVLAITPSDIGRWRFE